MKNDQSAQPVFDEKLAKPVPPKRHEPTGRTFAWVQGDALFSATGLFIAFEPNVESRKQPASKPPSV